MTGTESGAAEQPKKALTVRGATFLGIGSMIGAGIFALLGEAGAVAGAAVWVSFLIGGVVALLLGYVVRQARHALPVLGRPDHVPRRGLRQREAGRHRLVARLHRGDRDRDARWSSSRSAATRPRSSSAMTRRSWWHHLFITLVILAAVGLNLTGTQVRRARPVGDRGRRPRRLRLFIWVTDHRRRLLEARLQRLPVGREDPRERRADVLRLPRLQRDHLRGGRPLEAGARPAAGDVPARSGSRRSSTS